MDARPIGVFDSGMGGLTVLHECLVTMPHENFVYLGDAARLPYGPRPLPEIRRYAREIGAYLESQGVKLVLVACTAAWASGTITDTTGTSSSPCRSGSATDVAVLHATTTIFTPSRSRRRAWIPSFSAARITR